jgi:hypothetical protein
VTTGASNIAELNLLMKEVMLRRTKDEELDLPPKLRSWIPVDVSSRPSVLGTGETFLQWYQRTDPAKPNDKEFLGRLTKVRTQLQAAKHEAVAERIRDIVAVGEKVVVFTCYSASIERHKKVWGDAAVTITGSDGVGARQAAIDRFQDDPDVKLALCNIIAGGVGITLTAARHVLFQHLDSVPANHAQAEDRCYRLGQTRSVTVEYFQAANSLDEYIAELLDRKMQLIAAVESDEVPDASILQELQAGLRALAPAMLEEVRLARNGTAPAATIEALTRSLRPSAPAETEIEANGSWEFPSSRNPSDVYRVTFGRAGHHECNCKDFEFRGKLQALARGATSSLTNSDFQAGHPVMVTHDPLEVPTRGRQCAFSGYQRGTFHRLQGADAIFVRHGVAVIRLSAAIKTSPTLFATDTP